MTHSSFEKIIGGRCEHLEKKREFCWSEIFFNGNDDRISTERSRKKKRISSRQNHFSWLTFHWQQSSKVDTTLSKRNSFIMKRSFSFTHSWLKLLISSKWSDRETKRECRWDELSLIVGSLLVAGPHGRRNIHSVSCDSFRSRKPLSLAQLLLVEIVWCVPANDKVLTKPDLDQQWSFVMYCETWL